MEDDDTIFNLLDSCWFHHQILNKEPLHSSTSQHTPPVSTPTSATSMDELGSSFTCFSPSSVLPAARLPTIFSGKVAADSSPELPSRSGEKAVETETRGNRGVDQRRRKKKLQRGMSKSLSDLDFEELKGFIDLGFSFSQEDKNSEFLSTILPGLQSLGLEEEIQKEEEERKKKQAMKVKEGVGRRRRSVDESGYSRPNYLKMQRRKNNPLKTASMGEIPALGSEINMKDYLKSWAHSVASSVR